MKRYKLLTCALLAVTAVINNGCTDLLTEKPQSNIVPSAFATPAGLLGGIAGVYNNIRGAWGTEGFTVAQMAGTDEHLMGGSAGNPRVFNYNGLAGSDSNGGFQFYQDINALNGILELGPSTAGLDAATLKAYLGQAQFLRAFLYFYLVQTYGSIPLSTKFITVPSQESVPSTPAQVYEVIVQDLNDAITNLPNTPTAPFLGKAATVGAAKWLLAKVYLTRGWLLNSNSDFQLAYDVAKELIDTRATYGLDLWPNYNDAFMPANDYGRETIFVSDHSNDPKYGYYNPGGQQSGGAAINVTPWMGLFNAPSVVGMNSTKNAAGNFVSSGTTYIIRDVQFGRPYTRIRPNMPRLSAGPNAGKSYIFDQAFADRTNDSRYHKTFQTVWLTNSGPTGGGGQAVTGVYSGNSVTNSRGTLQAGRDTAIWFPDYEVPGAPQAFGPRPFKGIIVTPSLQTNTVYPYMKKLADPSRVNQNDPSTRPVVIARFSDVYLIAAEAAFKLGQLQNAADMINVVRRRAAFRSGAAYAPGGAFGTTTPATTVGDPYPTGVTLATAQAAMTITAAQVTLDFILDERTREFFGESVRWLDLVRTKSLVTRVKAWNPVEAGTLINDNHMLRPIPQDQIDRVVAGSPYPQNPGY
jgi:starch-binding outer membrane protein, SusD/RagB family